MYGYILKTLKKPDFILTTFVRLHEEVILLLSVDCSCVSLARVFSLQEWREFNLKTQLAGFLKQPKISQEYL